MTDSSSAARWRPETVAVAAGRPERVPDAPLNQPLVPAATYVGASPTDSTAVGYGRYGNPGWQALEQAIGTLEGGRCLTYSSGMAAGSAILDLFGPGTVVLRPAHCYLGVAAAIQQRVERHGWTVREADPADAEAFLAAARGADLIWLESPTNPMIEVADLAAIAAGREPGSVLVVDNTFATPLLQRPLELGADLVLHSATKIISGHSDALLGAVVVAEPDDHDHFGRLDAGRRLGGAIPGTLETYLVLRGLRTLPGPARRGPDLGRRPGRAAGRASRRSAGSAIPACPTIPVTPGPRRGWPASAPCCRSSWPTPRPRTASSMPLNCGCSRPVSAASSRCSNAAVAGPASCRPYRRA